MKLPRIASMGTALVVSVAAVLIATPSFGRYHHTWPGYYRHLHYRHLHYRHNYSTPGERVQTRALNHQQAHEWGLTATGETGIEVRRENAVARQHYGQQLDAYRAERRQYQNEMGLYRVRLGYYDLHRREPQAWWRGQFEGARPAGSSDALVGAEVDEPDGHAVGQIVDVHRYPAAHIARVEVALAHSDAMAWIDAAKLRYDATDRVVFTDMTADDIREASVPESE